MASRRTSLATNVPGPFFVDSSCIDCDACRWIAAATFDASGEHSRVHTQPTTPEEREQALLALIACPTGSIGADDASKEELARARNAYPVPIDGAGEGASEVFHCGWHSEASFGAASYLVRRPLERGGNVLVDSPRFSEPLARRLEELGGVATLFLTHADDVADHARFRERFGCRRIVHADDADEGTADVEWKIEGREPVRVDDELVIVPVPGHTKGSMCLLARDTFLFTGDHLAWSERRGHPYAFRSACWYDWGELVRSMERLSAYRFEWILPGHGRRCHFAADEMRVQMQRCLAWMKR